MGRGPSYPYIGLEESINIARKMYDYAKRAPAPVDSVITEAWGYTTTSSSGVKVLAALKAFGLVEDAPAASGKQTMKLTPRTIRILLDEPDAPARRDEIRKAALSPKWYEFCWKTWGKEMPASMKSTLLIEHGFVDSTVEGFLKDYRKTIAFAGLLDGVIFGEKKEEDEESASGPKVGDWVQCDMEGILRLPKPLKLTRIENHADHGKFGFVEGQKGGIEYKHLIKVEPPEGEQQLKVEPPPNLFAPVPLGHFSPAVAPPSKGEMKMEAKTFSDSNGVAGQLQWPSEMSAESYLDFLHELAGLRMRVRRAVRKESQVEIQSKDEEAAKEEDQERMERSR
jgi:hypothetical protein